MSAAPPSPAHASPIASPWVLRFAPLVPAGARVLDLACGRGRHARLFAERGCDVIAADRDAEALASLAGAAGIATRCIDLEAGERPFAAERFDAVVVINYLHRPLLPEVIAAVSEHGVLLYETFACGNEAYGRPSNPDHLLRPGELLASVAGRLAVVAFEQGVIAEGGRTAVIQRVAAVGLGRVAPQRLAPEILGR